MSDNISNKIDRPNVLFIICDDLNNAINNMGRIPFAYAPNIERIMKRGVTFINAQNNCPLCLPSRNSLYTGLYPHTTGQMTLFDDCETITPIATTFGYRNPSSNPINTPPVLKNWGLPLLHDSVRMPEYFKNNGYNVFGAGKTFHTGEENPDWWTKYGPGVDYGVVLADGGITERQRSMYEGEPLSSYIQRYYGIDRMFLDKDKIRFHIDTAFGPLSEICSPGKKVFTASFDFKPFYYNNDNDRDLLGDEKTANWGIEQLNKKHKKPFFLNLGFTKPHSPLNVPQKYFDKFPLESLRLPPYLEGDLDDCARALIEHRPYGFLLYGLITKEGSIMWKRWLQAYLACIVFLDDQVGKVLDALDNSRYKDNTIVVFTSDNGYHMGEKQYIFKDTLWEESSQIPLVISAPGITANNSICKRPVSLIDLYPTLIDFCGLPVEPNEQTNGWHLEGYSLRPLLEDPEHGSWNGPEVALTSIRGNTGIHYSVRSQNNRYTLCSNGEEELYNHKNDSNEWHNLAKDKSYNDIKAKLRQQLLSMVFPDDIYNFRKGD